MRVAILSPALPPARIPEADYVFTVAEALVDRGDSVHVLTSRTSPVAPARFNIHRVTDDWTWSGMPRLAYTLRRLRPDVVLISYVGWVYRFHPMATVIPSLVRRILPGTRVVSQTSMYAADPTILARWVSRAIARAAGARHPDLEFGSMIEDSAAVVVLSGFHRRVLAERRPDAADRIVVVPPPSLVAVRPDNDMARKEGRQALGIPEKEFVFSFFGYLYPGKGVDELVRAVAALIEEGRACRLLVIGGRLDHPDPSRDLTDRVRELCRDIGIADRVHWSGGFDIRSDRPSTWLFASDACVLPFSEGVMLSNSSAAAAAMHGLPLVTTAGDITDAEFIDGVNALLCPVRRSDALLDAMRRVMDDAALRGRLSEGAQALALEWFTSAAMAKRLEEVLEAVS